jgi:hypothetical protein
VPPSGSTRTFRTRRVAVRRGCRAAERSEHRRCRLTALWLGRPCRPAAVCACQFGLARFGPLEVTAAPASAGFGDCERDTARGAAEFRGDVYLGFENDRSDMGEVWRSADGETWVKAAPDGFGQGRAFDHVDALIDFEGQLYAGTDTGQIWRTYDGTLWTQATATPGETQNITDLAIFDRQRGRTQDRYPEDGRQHRQAAVHGPAFVAGRSASFIA